MLLITISSVVIVFENFSNGPIESWFTLSFPCSRLPTCFLFLFSTIITYTVMDICMHKDYFLQLELFPYDSWAKGDAYKASLCSLPSTAVCVSEVLFSFLSPSMSALFGGSPAATYKHQDGACPHVTGAEGRGQGLAVSLHFRVSWASHPGF